MATDRQEYYREYHRKNREKKIAATKAWREKNPGRRQDKRTRETERKAQLKHRYGITVEQYEEMFAQQKGVCAICGQPPIEGKTLNVDHDHVTGKVRGLLHGDCNRGLGLFKDSPDLLRRAAIYIESSSLS